VLVVDAATRSDAVPAGADVVLVSGTSVRHLADAAAVAALLSCGGGRVGLVLRVAGRGGVDPEDVAYHLDLPLLAVLRDDSRVATDLGRGRPPGTRGSDAVGTVADRVLDSVVGDGAAGMDGTAGARAAWAEGGPVTVRASRRGVA
jgi:hypothetical protein